jgi:DNA-3-methyladenine glycosylase II
MTRAEATAAMTLAVETLSGRDPVIGGLAARYGPPPARTRSRPGARFQVLVRAIVHQQLAGRAAQAIHGRLVEVLEGEVTPDQVLSTPTVVLRSAGLSSAKAAAITDLAEKVARGDVALDRMARLSDEDVVAHLVQVRGIGVWTAEMFLISNLGRLDVWPVGDLGVRAGYASAWQLEGVPNPKSLMEMGELYRPYRTVVAWYCWRVMDEP